MQSSEKKTFADLSAADYSSYLFEKNPFQAVPVALRDPEFLTDRDQTFDEIRRALTSSLTNKNFQGRMISGNFGMGKSHLLKYVRRRINIDLREGKLGRGVAAYASPGRSMFDLYREVIKDLGEEFLKEVSRGISGNVEPEAESGAQYALWQEVGRQKFVVSQYIKDSWDRLSPQVREKMDRDCFAALCLVRQEKFSQEALAWLEGDKIPRDISENMGISSQITKDTAPDALITLVQAIHQANYTHFFLCLDEMEKLTYLSARAKSEYFEQFRYVIDELTEGYVLFGAITPEAEKLLEEERHAFQSRLSLLPRLSIGPMDTGDVIQLVQDYMLEERRSLVSSEDIILAALKNKLANLQLEVDLQDNRVVSLFPFAADVIEAIGSEKRGNPRHILAACAHLIDIGAEDGRVYYNTDECLTMLRS